ncbi:zinc ribbon domain-containing protein [Nonomuraea sp. NPDC049419]|uniref:zinc ribbon domain-containing protein n=1 Tax=Nonomuraea sp. NPDC049419 TaxID=3155772 RepID=UPI00343920C9
MCAGPHPSLRPASPIASSSSRHDDTVTTSIRLSRGDRRLQSGTSRACARCGHCAKDNRLTQAAFACTACGHAAHADVNAAVDILRAGPALRQAAHAA